jgi:hypothetical protein
MLKKILAVGALTMFMGMAPTFGQEQPSTAPAPEAEQQPAAKTDAIKKAESAPHPRRVRHHWYDERNLPWNWVWYHLRYELRHHQRHWS